LKLTNRIPSHDTSGRVFVALNPVEFENSFMEWVQAIIELIAGQVIALDGKQLRGSRDGVLGKKDMYLVSAWTLVNQLFLGQHEVEEKSNEITAIPKLLKLPGLSGVL
jgi:hypothetical protein